MREDDQVKAALSLKKDILLNSGWAVSGDSDEVNEFVETVLKQIGEYSPMEPSFDESIRDLASAYDYGFALAEVLWRSPKDARSGMWELSCLKVRPPHSFTFEIDDYGKTIRVEQYGNGGTRKLDPSIFLHHVYQSDFGNPYGRSDLKAAFPAWKAKKFLFRMAMRYAERFAGGTVVGKYNPAMSVSEINAFRNMLTSLQDNSTLVMPNEDQLSVDIIQTERDSSGTYNTMLMMLNNWIARSILIPDLLGISGEQTKGGSYSLGREHFRVLMATIANDRMALERRITTKVVKPLVQVNFGEVKCEFKFKPMEVGDEENFLRLWVDAVNGKMFKPSDDEINHLRRKTGFPEGPVEIPEPAPVQLPAPQGRMEPGPTQEPEREEQEGGEEEPQEKVVTSRFARTLTPYEHKVDFARAKVILDGHSKAMAEDVGKALRDMADDMFQRAKERNLLDRFKPEAIAEMEPKFRKELNNTLKGHMRAIFRESVLMAQREILPKQDFAAKDIFPEDFDEILQADSFKMVGDLSNEIRKRFSTQLLDGIRNGKSARDMAESFAKNIEDYTEGQVRNVVRTKVAEVYNEARMSFFETDEVASGLIEGYQYSAILDETTTDICEALHGRQFSKDEVMARPEINPPLHWNAIAEGEKVLTIEGYKPIEKVRIGDKVMSHMGNWCLVYDTMRKNNSDWDFALELRADDSRVLLTPDHPILTKGHWAPAGSVRVGDHIFKSNMEAVGTRTRKDGWIGDSKNPVSESGNKSGSFGKLQLPVGFAVAANFQGYLMRVKNGVDKIGPLLNLGLKIVAPLAKKFRQAALGLRGLLPVVPSDGMTHPYSDLGNLGRVGFLHPREMGGVHSGVELSLAESGMDIVGTIPNGFKRDGGSLPLTPVDYPELPKFRGENVYARKSDASSDGSKGLSFSEVALLDHGVENGGVIDVHAKDYTPFNTGIKVTSIRRVPYSGMVYNLAVMGDESYVVNGIVVHNCRSQLVPITKFEPRKFVPIPPKESLNRRGANLVQKGEFAAVRPLELSSPLVHSGMAQEFGDHPLITAPGAGMRIAVHHISASNADPEKPVVVAFRQDSQSELLYPHSLSKCGGSMERKFDPAWDLGENRGLMINLSAPAKTHFTVEYSVIGPDGRRVR